MEPTIAYNPAPPVNPLDQQAKVMSLRSLLGQQQIQQQNIQAGALQNQQTQMDVDSQRAFQRAYTEANGDPDKTTQLAAKYGAKPKDLLLWQGSVIDQKMKTLDLVQKQGDLAAVQANLMQGAHDAVSQAAPEAKPIVYQQQLMGLKQRGIDTSQLPQQYPGDQQFAMIGATVKTHSQMVDEALKSSQTAKDAADAALTQIKVNLSKNSKPGDFDQLIDQAAPPSGANAALNSRTKNMVNFALQRGDYDGAQKAVEQMSNQIGSIEKETNPAVQASKLHLATAEKAAEQAIADGDPRAAAQLLISGTVAPSQLVSSRKPAFAQQAFTAAAQMQPGWSATKADADYKVASSPQNVGFFGSAKSLTDKGGTLDQLADAAKDIPGGKIPVFNSIADALAASTGSGPIAKYASILLGVADDYSKVMGGGQGSDTSRTQALKLVPANASPQARAAALEGIRGSVNSQTNSRIGNNPVLRKMYGNDTQGSATRTYQGHTYSQQSDGSWKLQQ
jgi:hypothetical protein